MKKFLVLMMVLFPIAAFAGEIVLTNPITIPAITKVTVDSYKYDAGGIIVWYSYRTADNKSAGSGQVLLKDECSLTEFLTQEQCVAANGTWNEFFSAVENDTHKGSDNGKKASGLMEKRIRTQLKAKLNIDGTVAE